MDHLVEVFVGVRRYYIPACEEVCACQRATPFKVAAALPVLQGISHKASARRCPLRPLGINPSPSLTRHSAAVLESMRASISFLAFPESPSDFSAKYLFLEKLKFQPNLVVGFVKSPQTL